jgi:hypothetical protein
LDAENPEAGILPEKSQRPGSDAPSSVADAHDTGFRLASETVMSGCTTERFTGVVA